MSGATISLRIKGKLCSFGVTGMVDAFKDSTCHAFGCGWSRCLLLELADQSSVMQTPDDFHFLPFLSAI